MNVQESAENAGSHTATDAPAGAQVEQNQNQAASADSPPATDGQQTDAKSEQKPDEIADVTRRVLDESRKKLATQADTASTPDAKAKSDKAAEADPKGEPAKGADKANEKPLPFHNHPRWKDLNEKFKTTSAELEVERKKVADLTPQAEIGKSVQSFMAENQLSADEFKYGQGIMALMKHSPADALVAIEKLATDLKIFLGHELPKDLQERVDAGELTDGAAKELLSARQRGETEAARATRLENESKATQASQAQAAITTATDVWWSGIKAKDPDMVKPEISALVVDKLTSLVTQHRASSKDPITPKMATEFCQAAYDAVKKTLKAIAPPKAAVDPIRTAATRNIPAQAGKAPQTMLDVTKGVLARTRGG